jgi:ribonuclease BN (tRNA processing enzyme)
LLSSEKEIDGRIKMEIVFLGVGEAFDPLLPNTAVLIRDLGRNADGAFLLACGFTVPPEFWKENLDVDGLDGLWISHFHGDHSLGLPALLVRFWEDGRRKGLTLVGQRGIEVFTQNALELAYPGFQKRIEFPVEFLELEPGKELDFKGLLLRSAQNMHSQRNLALRIDTADHSIYYSGDGRPSPECERLAGGCRLLIQEAFQMTDELPGHGTVMASMELAKQCGASHLALVHIQRDSRPEVKRELANLQIMAGNVKLWVPEPGDRLFF